LDIEINPENGRLRALQLVLQDERVPLAGNAVVPSIVRSGVPFFDTGAWTESDRYRDERMSVEVMRATDDRLEGWLDSVGEPALLCRVDSQLDLLFTAEGGLTAIRFGPLTPDEWSEVSVADTSA
jgi:hypothetical protein